LFARFVPAVLLVFWWASLFAVFARLFRGWGASRSLLAGAGASVVIVTTLAVTPTIGQSFYWVIVAPSYVIPFAVFPLLLMWSVCPTGQGNSWTSSRIWLLVSTGIAFVLAGFSETFSLLQVTLLSATVVGFIFWSGRAEGLKRKSVLRLEFALAGAVLGLVALVLAPGNEVRWNSMNIPRPGAFKALYQSFLYVGWWGVTLVVLTPRLFFLVWLFFFALTLGWGGFGSSAPGASWNAKRWASMAFAGPVATAAFVWVGVYPGAYVGGWGPPLRTLIIPTFVLVCGLGLTGFATGRWFAASEMGEKAWWGATSKRLPAAVAASALILSAAFVVRIGQKIPSHRAYATKFDAMDRSARRAKMEGLTRVVIEPLPSFDELGPFGPVRKQTQLDPIGPDSTFWVNRAVSRYYGITVVTSGNPPGP